MKQHELNDVTVVSVPGRDELIGAIDGLTEEIARLARDLDFVVEMRPATRTQKRPEHFVVPQRVLPHAGETQSLKTISDVGVQEGSIAEAGLAELHKRLGEFMERSKEPSRQKI